VSLLTHEETSYRIGELAERAGTTARTIRYYEQLGLLGRAAARKGAHRLYTDADVVRLQSLIQLRDLLGLSLDELVAIAEAQEARAALRGRWAESTTDAERLRIVDEAIPIVERQLELVSQRRQKLDEFAAELEDKLRTMRETRSELKRTAER
jgi:DNA-binding transcriptional MerR regulator